MQHTLTRPTAASLAQHTDHKHASIHAGRWFADLPQPLKDAIVSRARLREVAPGARIATRGEVGSHWIGVASGALKLGASLQDGRDFTLDFIGPSQWYGDIALIDNQPLDLDVTAHVGSTLLLVSRTDLRQLLDNFSELPTALLQLNCQRLRHMLRRFEEMQTLPLSQRLARQIQRLVHQFGRPQAEGMVVDLSLSQADLASIVGGSRQRVNRSLRQMHCQGILRLGASRLLVLDAARLLAVADGRIALCDGADISDAVGDTATEQVGDHARH